MGSATKAIQDTVEKTAGEVKTIGQESIDEVTEAVGEKEEEVDNSMATVKGNADKLIAEAKEKKDKEKAKIEK